jgi:hypothetical protein
MITTTDTIIITIAIITIAIIAIITIAIITITIITISSECAHIRPQWVGNAQ